MPTSQEIKVKNTFDTVSEQLDRYIQVFRSGGQLHNALDEMGGDTAWLVDVVEALAKAANAIDEASMSASSNIDENVEEGRMSDMLIHDSETLSKEEFAKKHGKDAADEYYEASMGAPDYNPAAGQYSSNMEYGMFSPEGDAEVEEIVTAACEFVENGEMDTMAAIDEAMNMLANLAETSKFEEADDTDVRDRVAREIQSRCDSIEESQELNRIKDLAGLRTQP